MAESDTYLSEPTAINVAVHEAGHTVVGHRVGVIFLQGIDLRKSEGVLGFAGRPFPVRRMGQRAEDNTYRTTMMGGIAAELAYFGDDDLDLFLNSGRGDLHEVARFAGFEADGESELDRCRSIYSHFTKEVTRARRILEGNGNRAWLRLIEELKSTDHLDYRAVHRLVTGSDRWLLDRQ